MMRCQSSRVGNKPVTFLIAALRVALVLEIGDDLAEAEHAHGDDDEADAVGELRQAERVARDAGVDVGADQPEQEPDHDHGAGVQERAAGQHDRGDETEHHQREVFGRAELQRHIAPSGGANNAISSVATVPAMNEPIAAVAKRQAGLALARHLVAVERGDDGR